MSWTAARPTAAGTGGRQATTVRRLWPVAAVYLLFAAGYIAYITFLSAYLADRHASTAQTTLTRVLLGLAATAAPGLWQRPIGHWPGGRILAVLLGVIACAAALALLEPHPAVVIVSALAYGATFMAVPAAVTTLVRGATPSESLAGALSAFTVIFAVGQMAGPRLAGALADHTGADATLGWTAALCCAGAVLAGTTVTPALRCHPTVLERPAPGHTECRGSSAR